MYVFGRIRTFVAIMARYGRQNSHICLNYATYDGQNSHFPAIMTTYALLWNHGNVRPANFAFLFESWQRMARDLCE